MRSSPCRGLLGKICDNELHTPFVSAESKIVCFDFGLRCLVCNQFYTAPGVEKTSDVLIPFFVGVRIGHGIPVF